MFRKLAIAAALSAASLVAVVPAASAQTSFTLSFGTGSYSYYDDGDQGYDPYGGYYYQQWPTNNYYNYNYDQNRSWQERQRREQIERWREAQAREYYWHREHRRDRDDDDD